MNKINLTFDIFTLKKPVVSGIIRKCIEAVLKAENITVTCQPGSKVAAYCKEYGIPMGV